MRVFRPRPTPAVIDADGRTIDGHTAADVEPTPETRALLDRGELVEVAEPPTAEPRRTRRRRRGNPTPEQAPEPAAADVNSEDTQ